MTRSRVVVVGFGVTGRSVVAHLIARGDVPIVFDDSPAAADSGSAGVEVRPTPGADTLAEILKDADFVVPSPGVPLTHPVYAAAARAGVPVRSEVEMAGSNLPGSVELVAITGTNGKTTVTTLVSAILEVAGRRVLTAGNIGVPLIDVVESGAEVVVAEVSSFQLQFTATFHPRVSCWLNLSPDHLDWHRSVADYAAAKSRIWANQGPGDTAVVNADDPGVVSAADGIPRGVDRRDFSAADRAPFCLEGGWLVGDGSKIMPVDALPRAFPHDLSNALAAAATATAAGATVEACAEALATIGPLPHRVALVGEWDGVAWYNDSKSTTPASVLAAVKGFSSVVLIAGGRNKGLDLRPLSSTAPPVRVVVSIGEAAAEVEAAFEGLAPVHPANSMEAAVETAASLAHPGDAVLLSPGCASFDWYPSYAARGEDFSRTVTEKVGRRRTS